MDDLAVTPVGGLKRLNLGILLAYDRETLW